MSERPHLIVSGLARCGTTLTMTMLHAAGVPCIGNRPDFEVEEIDHLHVDPEYLAQFPGHAFKLLDPLFTPLPAGMPPTPVIWLDRDPKQQARSQAKFIHLNMGLPMASRAHLRKWAAGLRRDRGPSLARFKGWPILIMRFENLIEDHIQSAAIIADFLRPWWQVDPVKMELEVLPRSAECAPDIEIELRLSRMAEEAEWAG
jgi:hypothetical protein